MPKTFKIPVIKNPTDALRRGYVGLFVDGRGILRRTIQVSYMNNGCPKSLIELQTVYTPESDGWIPVVIPQLVRD